MGVKISPYLYKPTHETIAYWCPGCNCLQVIPLVRTKPNEDIWSFNGNVNSPSFNHSVLSKTGHYAERQDFPPPPNCLECNEAKEENRETDCRICHSYVTNGMIIFLADCTHKLAGQRVPVPSLPDTIYR